MKRLLFLLLFIPAVASAADWYTAGVQTNPLANAILADTGPVPADSTRQFEVTCASTVIAVAFVEWRDSTNASTIRSQGLILPANQTTMLRFVHVPNFSANERVRLRLNTGITGIMQCSILME